MEQPKTRLAMHPKKFALWLFIVSITMMFMAWTSAFLVKAADGFNQDLSMPILFTVSTVIIALSSVTMQLAQRGSKKDELSTTKTMLILTMVLAVAFLVIQVKGWDQLVMLNHHFVGNDAIASFIYVLTGMHGLHIVSGMIFLLITLYATYNYKVHSKSMVLIQMCTTYWHFLGGLWIYLFLFLTVNLN